MRFYLTIIAMVFGSLGCGHKEDETASSGFATDESLKFRGKIYCGAYADFNECEHRFEGSDLETLGTLVVESYLAKSLSYKKLKVKTISVRASIGGSSRSAKIFKGKLKSDDGKKYTFKTRLLCFDNQNAEYTTDENPSGTYYNCMLDDKYALSSYVSFGIAGKSIFEVRRDGSKVIQFWNPFGKLTQWWEK